jgi:hypothetical protein
LDNWEKNWRKTLTGSPEFSRYGLGVRERKGREGRGKVKKKRRQRKIN